MQQSGCVTDLRQFKRIETKKAARLLVDDIWHDCVVLDISGGGARLLSDLSLAVGQAVVLADEELGLLAGEVQRNTADGLSLAFGVSSKSKHALIDRLTKVLNEHVLS